MSIPPIMGTAAPIVFLISEVAKIIAGQLQAAGKFDSLTQAEAEAMVQKISKGLPTILESPEELEQQPPTP